MPLTTGAKIENIQIDYGIISKKNFGERRRPLLGPTRGGGEFHCFKKHPGN